MKHKILKHFKNEGTHYGLCTCGNAFMVLLPGEWGLGTTLSEHIEEKNRELIVKKTNTNHPLFNFIMEGKDLIVGFNATDALDNCKWSQRHDRKHLIHKVTSPNAFGRLLKDSGFENKVFAVDGQSKRVYSFPEREGE